ncbi:MAG TPA: aminotransferase class I/II-fold pyridoxal phosphate-dependent enzyme [Candidatus Brocadiia bacterium]|nr:aminotransferase class I/II-fold pyridoxal phosphate-dependent enzyme [Candidatus Brocadiia bacterium]
MAFKIEASKRVQSIGAYAFAEVDKRVEELKAAGIDPIDFGVGDPTVPTPKFIRQAVKAGLDKHKSTGYPSYIGAKHYREAVCAWTKLRFGVDLDPAQEVTATIGAKEAVFNFPEGFINPGDVVIVPTPGYPPYARGTLFAEGESWFIPLHEENGFLPDLDAIPAPVLKKAKIMWINYPNNPTGAVAPMSFLRKAVKFAAKHNLILASDEAYSELYFGDEAPHSVLEITKKGVICFQSLSKRSAMTGHRVGWVAGDREIVSIFKKVKTNIDSGTPTFIQEGAIAALSDETHVKEMRDEYKVKRDILADALVDAGMPDCRPAGTIYLWQKMPDGLSSLDFALKLLQKDVAIVCTPGAWISTPTADGANPGEGYCRFALVPGVKQTRLAAKRIRTMKL